MVVGGGRTVDELVVVVSGADVVVGRPVVDVTAHSGWSASPTHDASPTSASSPVTTAARRTRFLPPWCTVSTLEVVPIDR
jgi:hypothetical protein